MYHDTDRTAYTTAFVTPVVEYWLEREIAQWVDPMKLTPNSRGALAPIGQSVHNEGSIRRPIASRANALTMGDF